MAQKITIQKYADIKGLMVYDIVQNAKEKGVILPEDPEYVLDDSQLRQIDPIFAHQNKYKQIIPKSNIGSNESAPKIFTLKKENQLNEEPRVLGKIDLSSLNQRTRPKHRLKKEQNKKKCSFRRNYCTVKRIWQYTSKRAIYRKGSTSYATWRICNR